MVNLLWLSLLCNWFRWWNGWILHYILLGSLFLIKYEQEFLNQWCWQADETQAVKPSDLAESLAFFFSQIREFLYYSFPDTNRGLLKLPLCVCNPHDYAGQVRDTGSNLQFQSPTMPKIMDLSVLHSCYSILLLIFTGHQVQIRVHSTCERHTLTLCFNVENKRGLSKTRP